MVAVVVLTLLFAFVPRKMGYSIYYVTSGSMEPYLPVYSIAYMKPTAPELLKEGDIAAFRSGNSIVVHRVMSNHVEDRKLITKGDANDGVDLREISYDNVKGRIVRHYPRLGELLMIYLTGFGKAMLAFIGAGGVLLLLAAGRLKKLIREVESRQDSGLGETGQIDRIFQI